MMRGIAILALLPSLAFGAPPYLVTDLAPGPDDGGIDSPRAAGTTLVFRRYGQDLWRSDATEAGTTAILTGATRNLATHGDRVFFTRPSATVPREDLWSTDGTSPDSPGSAFVATVTGLSVCFVIGGSCTEFAPLIDSMTSVGDLLFFRANFYFLWRSDGTTAGTSPIYSVSGQFCSTSCLCCFTVGADLYGFARVNERLFFTGSGPVGRLPLLAADRTSVTEVPLGFTLPIVALEGVRGRLFFIVTDFPGATGLWKHDGNGTFQIALLGDGSRDATQLTAAGGFLYLVLGEGTANPALWRSDGTAAGTFELLAADVTQLTAVGDRLFFRRGSPGGDELWTSDGTPAGTTLVAPLGPSHLTDVGGTLFFAAADAAGEELWQSDGTPLGTARVADIVPGPGGSAPADLTAACGRLYFTATTPETGRELWALDLTPGVCAPLDQASCTSDTQCSDGNACNGTESCNPATGCQVGTPLNCDDGDTCTVDTCNRLTGCSHAPTPTCPPCPPVPATCRTTVQSGASSLELKDGTPDTKDQLVWKWAGQATPKADYGNPLATDHYALCLYDAGTLVASATAGAGGICAGEPCWTEKPGGFLYEDKELTPSGIRSITLNEGLADGKADIAVKGNGAPLDMPAPGTLTGPLAVRLHRSEAATCWGADFSAPFRKQEATLLQDTSD
jgi:ELWxxDGT repeat protein